MISRYKQKIILWYTGLLAAILIAVFGFMYSYLGLQLHQDIDRNLRQKVEWIDQLLVNPEEPPDCSATSRLFLRQIIRRGRYNYDFYDIKEMTDVVDDKYILFVYCGDKLMYLSKKYYGLQIPVRRFEIPENTIGTFHLKDITFSMASISKNGYTLYVGYELSIIRAVKKQILNIFLLVFPFGVGLSILCGYFVTQRSLKVIHNITKTAARISSRNLSERMEAPKEMDEIANLIRTLNSMIDRLEQSFTMVQQFSHDAAHEIRTPLTVIRGEIEELLKDEGCPENISGTLESILEEIQYLSSITDKLLLIHTLDTGRIEYHFTEINLEHIVQEVYEDAQVLSQEKKLDIRLKQTIPSYVRGNEELLIRLMWNVADNAIKYTPAGGRVTMSLEKSGDNAVITVEDTGLGIPVDDIPKIFNRFYRVAKSRSRELGGSGLGLAICKWIVELHGGFIRVHSEVKKGSRFIIRLPLLSVPEQHNTR